MIKRAEERVDYPIPVLFNLSSWKEKQHSIQDWLIAELKSKYGVRKSIGKEWVDNHQLLPMLDGLDEIETTRQEVCVQEINKFLQGEYRPQYLVICSRSEEYGSYETRFKLNGAICLQPLSDYKIYQYLVNIKCSELWHNLESESSLLDLARTPLLLSTMVLTSNNISIQKWQTLNSKNERLEYLFNDYINWMLKREIKNLWYFPKKTPTLEKTKRQLVWLAKKLKAESQTEFLIEKMQPSCLPTRAEQQMYRIGIWIISGLSIGVISTPVLALVQQRPISWLVFALFNGLIFVLISELIKPISKGIHKIESNLRGDIQENIQALVISILLFRNKNYGLVFLAIYQVFVYTKGKYISKKSAAFSGGIVGGIIFWIIFVIFRMEPNFEIFVLFAALFYGLLSALLSGLNEGIKPVESLKWSWMKTQNGWQQGSIFGVFSGLFLFLILRVFFGTSVLGLVFELILGLTGGLFGALFSGFSGPDIDNHKIPNQGIRKSVVNAGFFILLGALFGILLGGFVGKLLFNQLVFGIVFGLVCGIILGIFFRSNQGSPGIACIQHFTLRLILYFNGYIPWNYARFLDYCTERMFLQRVGGRYRFIHKMLQDHFAQMPLDTFR